MYLSILLTLFIQQQKKSAQKVLFKDKVNKKISYTQQNSIENLN